jgi:cobalt-zinc-cadmium efflux system outer membrane protein
MELRRAEREIIATRRQLAAMWGETEPLFTAAGNIEEIEPPPPLPQLLERLERNPELTRWDIEVQRRTANVNLERAKRIPDVTVAAGARHYSVNDDFAAVVDFSVPLPLFDRNQGGVVEAEQLLAKARADRDAARLQVRSELLAAYDELQTQFERIAVLAVQVLADAKSARTEVHEAYRRGAAHSIDVLAAQRVLVELQGEYFQALADYHTALVEVDRLTATPMSEATAQ